jgi:heme exporter protein A
VLKLKGLSCERDNNTLFSNLTLDIHPGTFVNVIGQNGAGKTSLLKVLSGLWQPTTGCLSWCGQLLPGAAPFFWAALLYIGHESQLQPTLTPLQNLKGWLSLGGVTTTTSDIEKALAEVGLESSMHVPCEVLSRGQRQRVLLARLWIYPPVCWILDEPFTALDTDGILLLHKRFETHLSQGGIIITATHQTLTLHSETFLKISLC